MKKFIALALAMFMLLTLAACGEGEAAPTGETPQTSNSSPATGTQVSEPDNSNPDTQDPTQSTTGGNTSTESTPPETTEPASTDPTNPAPTTPSVTEPAATNPPATNPAPTAPAHTHSWAEATCTAPKTCKTCQATEGSAKGHSWTSASCTAPKTCSTCTATEGNALGHNWKDASCEAPKTCSQCGATEGNILEHTYQDGLCAGCGDRQLGYGRWRTFELAENEYWGKYLSVQTLVFHNDANSCDWISNGFCNVNLIDPDVLQEMIAYGEETITYEGETYICSGAMGGDFPYEISGNTATLYSYSHEIMYTLQKTAKDQFIVTTASDSSSIQEGMVFTFIG